jgi:hypothetical protein
MTLPAHTTPSTNKYGHLPVSDGIANTVEVRNQHHKMVDWAVNADIGVTGPHLSWDGLRRYLSGRYGRQCR